MLAARVCPHSCETPRVRMNGHCVRRSNQERLTLRPARACFHARVSPEGSLAAGSVKKSRSNGVLYGDVERRVDYTLVNNDQCTVVIAIS